MLTTAAKQERNDEFAPGAAEWPEGLSRRQFLELSGATLALAGLVGCNRPPQKTIVPYVTPPERELLDGTLYYASALPWEGFARGVLVRSNSGRPTKIEGNPAHPDSLGATDILMQASVLSLYDPDRSQTPRRLGRSAGSDTTEQRDADVVAPAAPSAEDAEQVETSWQAFEDYWLQVRPELIARHGAGLALLTEPTTSPTFVRTIHTLLDRFPQARWYQHTPLPRYDRDGEQEDYDFEQADIVLAIDADFLFSHPSSLRYARAFAKRRRIENGKVNANRLYTLEPAPSITGSMADHHLPVSPERLRRLLAAIGGAVDGREVPDELREEEKRYVRALAADLRAHSGRVLVIAGERTEPHVRDWARAVNARFGADGATRHALPAVRSDGDGRGAGDLAKLVQAMAAGQVDTLIVVSANPAYTAAPSVAFADALKRVPRRIHLGSHRDETAALCEWHLPESHELESWSDLRAYDGTASIVQPLIAPLYESRSAAEFLFFLAEGLTRSDYDLVRETWQKQQAAAGEDAWRQWLNAGVIHGTANERKTPAQVGRDHPIPPSEAQSQRDREIPPYTLVLRPDPNVRDGRWANNGWLQELPKPHTQLVWDNPVLVSPRFAGALGVKNGDILTLHTKAATVDVAIWVAPAVADDCLIAHLGYGRTRSGLIGTSLGFDAYVLRPENDAWTTPLQRVTRKDGRVLLVSTHAHFSMEGRDIVRTANAADPAWTAGRAPESQPSLYPEWSYDTYRWGMLIDLGTCIGCKACVIACQAENNTPVVGKDQVSRGREMHWLRVDQYYDGDPSNPEILHQPVPCMQCEKAPCELVCPTAATVHSSEGLNDMVYNRCIGTRYCSNNCPYKVRRFNFLDYREPRDSTVYLQKNPDVTVRSRGVMEKCTYCVQRINAGRILAEKENRRVRDGEVRTACQQACPTEAIVFGDLNDPNSRVRARKAEPTHYVLLEELNTQPRTTYLARITNKAAPLDAEAPNAKSPSTQQAPGGKAG